MKRMRIAVIAAVLALFTLAGCGDGQQTSSTAGTSSSSTADDNSGSAIGFPAEGVSVKSVSVKQNEVELTAEQSEKICSYMKDVKYLQESVDLAIMSLVEVEFSDGSILTVDKNPDDYASYGQSGKSSQIVTVPHELKAYILDNFAESSSEK